jgi:hypothetical protein
MFPRAILLPMQIDPIQYWQEVTDSYRQRSDGELLEVAADIGDLTEVAQQILRDEMKKRGLSESKPADPHKIIDQHAVVHWESPRYRYMPRELSEESETPHEFTWKTLLCECETSDEAWQIGETLRRAGIECWVTGSRAPWDLNGPRVQVAADQLEQAQAVLAKPIPREIIEDLQTEMPEFELPACPKCGAQDPVLETFDPVNKWLCEACGAQWSDPEPDRSTG